MKTFTAWLCEVFARAPEWQYGKLDNVLAARKSRRTGHVEICMGDGTWIECHSDHWAGFKPNSM